MVTVLRWAIEVLFLNRRQSTMPDKVFIGVDLDGLAAYRLLMSPIVGFGYDLPRSLEAPGWLVRMIP